MHLSKWYILDERRFMCTFYGRVKLSEGIFWMSVVGYTFFIGGWG